MTFQMHEAEWLSIEQMQEFLLGSRQVEFELEGKDAVYGFLERVLRHQHYGQWGKRERGVIRAYLVKLSGLSRSQTTRLIARWSATRQVRVLPACRPNFPRRYRSSDVALLAQVDATHEDLSGPAIRRILQREYTVYGKPEFERLAELSVSHLYNLRRSVSYRRRRVRVQPTRGKAVSHCHRHRLDRNSSPTDVTPQQQAQKSRAKHGQTRHATVLLAVRGDKSNRAHCGGTEQEQWLKLLRDTNQRYKAGEGK